MMRKLFYLEIFGWEVFVPYFVFCPEVFGRGGKDKDGFKTEHHRDSGQSLYILLIFLPIL